MESSANYLNNITIVLHRPRFPENIGASVRAACNMGISRLILVAPENCDLTRILKMCCRSSALYGLNNSSRIFKKERIRGSRLSRQLSLLEAKTRMSLAGMACGKRRTRKLIKASWSVLT